VSFFDFKQTNLEEFYHPKDPMTHTYFVQLKKNSLYKDIFIANHNQDHKF